MSRCITTEGRSNLKTAPDALNFFARRGGKGERGREGRVGGGGRNVFRAQGVGQLGRSAEDSQQISGVGVAPGQCLGRSVGLRNNFRWVKRVSRLRVMEELYYIRVHDDDLQMDDCDIAFHENRVLGACHDSFFRFRLTMSTVLYVPYMYSTGLHAACPTTVST